MKPLRVSFSDSTPSDPVSSQGDALKRQKNTPLNHDIIPLKNSYL